MTMTEALGTLGVRDDTLSLDDRAALDENGYLALPTFLSNHDVRRLRSRFDELIVEEGDGAGQEVHQEEGTHRLANLVNKGAAFEVCFTHPKILAAMRHVLGPEFKLSSLNGRAPLPGSGLQALHADWPEAVEPGDYRVCNSIWLLSDFTQENGATRVVPGSHRSGKHPRQDMEDPKASHPDEVILTEAAGTIAIFNSHVWHGGTLNRTDKPRYGLHAYFCRRDQKQQTDQKAKISNETYSRLSEAARTVLDVT